MPSKPWLERRGRAGPPQGARRRSARGRLGTPFFGRLAARALCVATAGFALLLGPAGALAQAPPSGRPPALQYFLDEAPPDSVLSELRRYAHGLLVAKVRVVGVDSTVPSPEAPPGVLRNPPPYRWTAEVEATAWVVGFRLFGRRFSVQYGPTRPRVRYIQPLPRERETRVRHRVGHRPERRPGAPRVPGAGRGLRRVVQGLLWAWSYTA